MRAYGMIPPLEIFRVEKDGSLLWCESVSTVEMGKARIEELAAEIPAQYVIISLTTGQREVFGSSRGPGSAETATHDLPDAGKC